MTARCSHGLRWFRCQTCGERWVPWTEEYLAAEDPFFSASHSQPTQAFELLAPQPLILQMFLRARTMFLERYWGRHLRAVD